VKKARARGAGEAGQNRQGSNSPPAPTAQDHPQVGRAIAPPLVAGDDATAILTMAALHLRRTIPAISHLTLDDLDAALADLRPQIEHMIERLIEQERRDAVEDYKFFSDDRRRPRSRHGAGDRVDRPHRLAAGEGGEAEIRKEMTDASATTPPPPGADFLTAEHKGPFNMTNSNPKNLPVEWRRAAEQLLKAASGAHAPLMKFRKGKYFVGESEIPLGNKFTAYCCDWVRGWVKFRDDEITDKRIGRAVDGFEPCERDELGDMNTTEWELDDDKKPRDPWVAQNYLPLEDAESGEQFVFVTSSVGDKIAIEILCQRYARNIQRGLPTVRLAVGTFHTRKYRDTPRPDFPIMSWENDRNPDPVDITPPGGRFDDEGLEYR
jgi:hypothetical protein